MLSRIANILKRPEYAGKVLISVAPELIAIANSRVEPRSRGHGNHLKIEETINKITGDRQQIGTTESYLGTIYTHYLPAYFQDIHMVAGYTGPYMDFYQDGSVRCQGAYNRGKRTGYWTYFYYDGTKNCEGAYSIGNKVGEWIYWDYTGKLVAIRSFSTDI
jgi:hypothetical protein